MLRAASGQLGTARIGPLPPDTRNLPRLNAIASSSGSLASNRPPTGSARVNALVAMVSDESGRLGRAIETVREARSQRMEMCVP